MLKSCQFFNQGGDYSEREIEWYKNQMNEIDEMLQNFQKEKGQEIEEINEKLKALLNEPYESFEEEYKTGKHNLIAKEVTWQTVWSS